MSGKHPGKLGDRFFLVAAKAGDWEELASYCERCGEMTPAIGAFLARVLRGQEKRLPYRPPSGVTMKAQLAAAAYALALKASGVRNFRIEAGNRLGVGQKYLARALAQWKAFDPRCEEVECVIAAIAPSLKPEALKTLQSYFPTASSEALKALKLYFERDKNRGAGWAITRFDYVMTEKEKKPET